MSPVLSTWVQLLPLAVAVGINPLPIIAMVLVLLTPRGRAHGSFMLLGWILGLLALAGLALLLGNHTSLYGSQGDSTVARAIQAALGIGLLGLAVHQWRDRPQPGSSREQPRWLASLADLTGRRALAIGLLLSGGNPKNILLTLTAMAAVVEVGMSAGQELLTLVGFILVASLGVAIPLLVVLAKGSDAQAMLQAWRSWLSNYSSVVMAVVLAAIGTVLILKALG